MIEFNERIFKTWQSDYGEFNRAFRFHCFMQFRVFGVHADFVPTITQQIHEQWNTECNRWLAEETSDSTDKLSYLKRASLLLHSLISLTFLGNMKAYEYKETPLVTFRGTNDQFTSAKRDLIDGREIILSLDFVLNIIHYFESNRVDRVEDFRIPLTEDMRHDLINYLFSDSVDNKALYLILKALYLRSPSGGSAN